MKSIIGWLLCRFGRHKWDFYDATPYHEYHCCERCGMMRHFEEKQVWVCVRIWRPKP